VKIYAIPEGTVVFPKLPLITVEGPLSVCQLLETPLLNLVNYASLVTTNASRFRLVAGNDIQLLEFGLRRAQGPNGGLSASKYCYIGGFDATSNMLGGKLYGIPVKGTQAHSFIEAFESPLELTNRLLKHRENDHILMDLYELAEKKLDFLLDKIKWGVSKSEINKGELAAFCAYANSFPNSFFALIDTYSVLESGLINFCALALALDDLGYRAKGCRIDSGDLSYLSRKIKARFNEIENLDPAKYAWVPKLSILASNDINEETIESLNKQNHCCSAFAVGTHLVTCQKQPALGCVFKLVALNGTPRIKLSQDIVKINVPSHKKSFRLYGKDDKYILDLMMCKDEPDPEPGKKILCRHPFEAPKRAHVFPSSVEPLQLCFWSDGMINNEPLPSLNELRNRVTRSLNHLREDHLRSLNPTPYKVSVTETLYQFLHKLWLDNAPIGDLE